MRKLFILAFAANVILTLVSLVVLPPKVAIHFGSGGVPNAWASKEVNALIFLAIEGPLFILFLFAPSLVMKCPPKLINLPNKDYWLKEENKPATKAKVESLMCQFGIALFGFLFCVGLLTLQANLSDPVRLNESILFAMLTAFIVYTVYWCVKIFLSFRLPNNVRAADQVP